MRPFHEIKDWVLEIKYEIEKQKNKEKNRLLSKHNYIIATSKNYVNDKNKKHPIQWG
jgi:hypothetical protein